MEGASQLAATAAGDALIPVYTVGLGSDKRPMNLRVVDLEAPERVYPGDKFTLTGYVQAQNFNRGSVSVELMSSAADGRTYWRMLHPICWTLSWLERAVDISPMANVPPENGPIATG